MQRNFNLIIIALVSFVFTAILGKFIIPILKKLKVGQSERLDRTKVAFKKTRYSYNGRNYDNYFHCSFFLY